MSNIDFFLTSLACIQVLFSHHYTSSFDLFIALAILTEHRDIICRYLVEFDEVSTDLMNRLRVSRKR
jgi:hypothetical protein